MTIPLAVGDRVRFVHQLSEADVYLFAAVTGDSNEDHVDATSPVARRHGRIAHGAYLVALMSTASALLHQRHGAPTVSAGYDHVRFVRPVPIGTTIEVCYEVDVVDEAGGRAEAAIVLRDDRDEVLAVARHLIAFLEEDGTAVRARGGTP